jgi:hypothetical protein
MRSIQSGRGPKASLRCQKRFKARLRKDLRHRNTHDALLKLTETVGTLAAKAELERVEQDLSERIDGIERTQRQIVGGVTVGASLGGGILYAVGKKLGCFS